MILKNKKGFTLIELLVVISIIALMSTIVIASLNSARDKAKISQWTQNVVQLKKAVGLYYSKYGSFPLEELGTPGAYYNTEADGDGFNLVFIDKLIDEDILPAGTYFNDDRFQLTYYVGDWSAIFIDYSCDGESINRPMFWIIDTLNNKEFPFNKIIYIPDPGSYNTGYCTFI